MNAPHIAPALWEGLALHEAARNERLARVSKPNPFLHRPAPRALAAPMAQPLLPGDDALMPVLAALTRLAVDTETGRSLVFQGLARIAEQFDAVAVRVLTKDARARFSRTAGWSKPGLPDAGQIAIFPADLADEIAATDWAALLARGDAVRLVPGDDFPAAPLAMVTLVPLRVRGDLAGVLHVQHDPAGAPAAPGPVQDPGFAAMGDLVQLLMRSADQAGMDQDMLTGLPDGRGFGVVLAQATPDQGASVLIVGIDNFRSIKTVLGRAVSDSLMRAMSDRLGEILGNHGTLARSDGDAFAVLVPGGAQAADRLARDFRQASLRPFELDQITVYATTSIGISRLSSAGEAPQVLVRQAEVASFAAKTAGGNRLARYTRTMDARMSRRGQVVQALRHALRTDQFTLAFQPKFRMAGDPLSLTLAGAEALLRWNTPTLGEVSPEEFIPIAEASGVITEIDSEVIAIFARQLGKWRRAGHLVPASINVSPRSFEDDTLARRMLDLLAHEGVAPRGVTVEITETSLISMSPAARSNLDQLRAAGIALSVDDFGTGYSSLGYLQDLIVSEIKIDKRFILPLPPQRAACGTEKIVRTILALAKTLDIRVVAEGVETPAQAAWLAREGCHLVQGYLGGRAVGPEAFEDLYLRG